MGLGQADAHIDVARTRLVAVGAAAEIPPAQAETEIAIVLVVKDRMMDAVHVGRDKKSTQNTVGLEGEAQIGVVEEGTAVEDDLENEVCPWRDAEAGDGGHLDEHRGDNLDGMEAHARCGIDVAVGVVDAMDAPENMEAVEGDVVEVDDKIEDEQ